MRKKQFLDKVTVVTGAGRGIGKNIAHAFGKEGAKVIICDIDKCSGKSTRDELRKLGITTVEFMYTDLALKGAAKDMIQKVVKKWGKIDILVNNARSGQKKTNFLQETEDSWERGMSVTLRAAFFAAQEAIRSMSKTGGGNIVNISSISSLFVCHESVIYHIAKAAIEQMTRYLAVKAGCYGIRVNAVVPGFIVQDEHQPRYNSAENRYYRQIAKFLHPLGRVGKSDDVSSATLYLCAPETEFVSGHCLVIDGAATLQEQSTLLYGFNAKKKENGV